MHIPFSMAYRLILRVKMYCNCNSGVGSFKVSFTSFIESSMNLVFLVDIISLSDYIEWLCLHLVLHYCRFLKTLVFKFSSRRMYRRLQKLLHIHLLGELRSINLSTLIQIDSVSKMAVFVKTCRKYFFIILNWCYSFLFILLLMVM